MRTLVERARLRFELPPALEATAPIEARGRRRDDVRMMVSDARKAPVHAFARDLPAFVRPGDVLVVNTSGTLAAELQATLPDHRPAVLHLSTPLPGGGWVVEPRLPDATNSTVWSGPLPAGTVLALPGGASATLEGSFAGSLRLWTADLRIPSPLVTYLGRHGAPIRYSYVPDRWGIEYYQTVFARDPGSAEMPSAGRAFTNELVTHLVTAGAVLAPITLHTGVSSLEGHERPYPEWARVPATTADLVTAARTRGHRVIAVGTTVVRALESAVDSTGRVRAFDGWTDLVVGPERGVHAVDGILTGWHEPEASHLLMLEAIAAPGALESAYGAALEQRYLWHEFGDVHLLLNPR